MECTQQMKPHQIFPLLTAAMLIMSYTFPAITVMAGTVSENSSDILSEADSAPEPESVSENHSADSSDEDAAQESTDMPLPAEAPGFLATLEHCSDGYIVKGYFSEFLPDTIFVQPQSSLDGEYWQDCGIDWHLSNLGDEDPDSRYALENQICLYETFEPLKSYLDGSLNRFWLRLLITRENGVTYETQAAVIERGEFGQVPDDITCTAGFAPAMLFRETNSTGGFTYCGRYQLTANESSSPEDIAAFLPATVPVQVELCKGKKLFADCIIDCPVTWKPLSLPTLTAGESVILRDAAEEIVIPAGTSLSTPMGGFTLSEPLGIEQGTRLTDEVVLVLNVISCGQAPTGVLAINNNELKMAFDLKPTGAASIRVYTLAEGDAEWSEITGLPILNAVNAQPSTANSGYTDILSSSQEPYRSYLDAAFSKEEPRPFLVGFKIEGGVYDGCQLILACPDTYDLPPDLIVGGSGGNEGNAGSDNREDSTAEGQRPNLPHDSSDKKKDSRTDPSPIPPTASDESCPSPATAPASVPEQSANQPKSENQTPDIPDTPQATDNTDEKLLKALTDAPSDVSKNGRQAVFPDKESKPKRDTSHVPVNAPQQSASSAQPPAAAQTVPRNTNERSIGIPFLLAATATAICMGIALITLRRKYPAGKP